MLWDDKEAIEAEMRRVIPVVKEKGGYIFSSDHSVPSAVSLDNFRTIVDLAKVLGSYDCAGYGPDSTRRGTLNRAPRRAT